MNPHVKNFWKEIAFEEKRRYCRDGIRIAIMQIYDQEKRREIQDWERIGERDKMIVSLPKTPKKWIM
jgi:hypothetical protein